MSSRQSSPTRPISGFAGAPGTALPLYILRFLVDAIAEDEHSALATLTGVTGSSARGPGTHMAVLGNGSWAGSVSGGCVEAAIAAEGLLAIERNEVRNLKLGAGSPYIDIRLPCGGGIDLLLTPNPEAQALERAVRLLENRKPVSLILTQNGNPLETYHAGIGARTGWQGEHFCAVHAPPLRLVIAGNGAECAATVRIARAWGAETVLISSSPELLEWAKRVGVSDLRYLLTPTSRVDVPMDPWTALLLLFHDHEWETELLMNALGRPALYIGGMGSKATHVARIRALRDRGAAEAALRRIRGPVGLIPSSRDPATLALSAFAEIVGEYRAAQR